MTEMDLPEARQPEDDGRDHPGDGPAGRPVRRPPRRRGRRRLFALVLLALVAAVAAIVVSHAVPSTVDASAPQASSGSGDGGPVRLAPPTKASRIAPRVDAGLVDINVTFGYQGARGAATGMVLTPTGEVLTNNHVIDGATAINVTDIGNGKTYSASVVGYDRSRDLAVLQLKDASGLATTPLGDSSSVAEGAAVTAFGNAGGTGGTPSQASGTVTALNKAITASDAGGGNPEHLSGLIQTDAAIQPGDSGGPLVNSAGQVVGMDAAAAVGYAFESTAGRGFAIPINDAIAISRQIEAGAGSSQVHIGPTGFLGIDVASPATFRGRSSGSQTAGALLGGVLPGSPADRAGLAQGDLITSLDGHAIGSATVIPDLLVSHHPGDTVQIRWVDQSGQTHTASVRLASGPPA
jgi:S1-C subfamily serine protease